MFLGQFDRQQFLDTLVRAGASPELAEAIADEERKLLDKTISQGFYGENLSVVGKLPNITEDIVKACLEAHWVAQEQVLSSSVATKRDLLEIRAELFESIVTEMSKSIVSRLKYIEMLLTGLFGVVIGVLLVIGYQRFF